MLSSKQTEYLSNCNHRWNIKIGATGSGKSWLDYAYVVPKRLTSLKGQGASVILGNTQGTANRNIIEPMRSIWGEKLVGTIGSDNAAMLFGQKVYVLGADNKKHVARIQGMTIEYAYGDEMTTWAEPVFQMLKSRLRCEHSYFDGTANPDTPLHYIKKFIDSDIDIFCQTSTIFDNPFLPKEFVENLCKEYEGTVYYDRFILGKWALAEGMIYPMHKDAIADLPEGIKPTQYCLSIDYGTMNAFSAGLWGKYGDVWYRLDEYYYSGRDTGVQKTDEEYAVELDKLIGPIMTDRMNTRESYFEKMETIIDPSAASFITLLRKKQWYKVIPADNSVLDGIRDTASAMQTGKIKIATNCKNIIKEMQGYVWDSNEKEDKPVKINDHAVDDLRYFVKTKRIAVHKSNYVPKLYR